MAHHHDQAGAKLLGGELDTANLCRRHNVAGYANHKQMTEAEVEHDLCWHTRVGTTKDNGEWLLAGL